MSRFTGTLGRIDRVTWLVAGIGVVAFVMRVGGLEVRAMHHDESLHATYSWYLAEGRGYQHNPLMHGPVHFHLMALFYTLFGDSEAVSRWPHALFGTALIFTPLLLRKWLGGSGTVLAALLLAVSPATLYYSRFAREDAFIALFTVLQFIAIWRYRDDGRERWLLVFAAATALAFATKESAYLTAAVLLLYLNGATAHELFWQSHRGERVPLVAQVRSAMILVPVAWIIAALWRPLWRVRERHGMLNRPREADLLVVTGTLVLPLLAAVVRIPAEALAGDLDLAALRRLGIMTVLVLWVAAAAVGLLWDARRWPLVAAIFLLCTVPLYTTFGTNMEGIAGPWWTSLDYWLEQHDVRRGDQPWFYYVMMLPLYESLALWPALAGGAWLVLRRRDAFATLLAVWFGGTFIALSIAGEKMPWLVMHQAIPLAFLAAYVLGKAGPAALTAVREQRGSRVQWAAGGIGVTFLVLAFALALHTNLQLNVKHPDTPVEPLIYVQTTSEVPEIARDLRAGLEAGDIPRVVVDTSSSLTWPWAWYLRGLNVTYVPAEEIRTGRALETGDLVVVHHGTITSAQPLRLDFESTRVYGHRHWFPEAGYRGTTFGSLARGILDGSILQRWAHFLVYRGDDVPIGKLWGEVFYPPLELR
ncbi:MAG: TIGR03663 family protein [Chloroflexi bacterium]|nr:TIGR03663 family protein [Chloroflexota bacterium]MQC25647.1 TIGR03663 family protein [Chloroflexota bacterium]MQC48079.1 TIGR03663 family protein [Chloroflexota bacterium]